MNGQNLSKKQERKICGELIKLVKKFPVIYDLQYKGRRSKKEKTAAWAKISEAMPLDAQSCKIRWEFLKHNYETTKNLVSELMNLLSFLDVPSTDESGTTGGKGKNQGSKSDSTKPEKSKKVPQNSKSDRKDEHVDGKQSNTKKKLFKQVVNVNIPPPNKSCKVSNEITPNNLKSSLGKKVPCDANAAKKNCSKDRDKFDEVHESTKTVANSNQTQILVTRKRKAEADRKENDEHMLIKREKYDEVDDQSFLNFLKHIHFVTRNFPLLMLNKLKLNIFRIVTALERDLMENQDE